MTNIYNLPGGKSRSLLPVWLRLRELGYDVIPLGSGKDQPERGWPTMPNTPADIARWRGHAAGIRTFDSGLIIWDYDTQIEIVRDKLIAGAEEEWPDFMRACLRRHSGGSRIALIGRCPDPGDLRTQHTLSFYPGAPRPDVSGRLVWDKLQKNQLEGFTTNSVKYLGVLGMHSVGREYGYVGRTILDTPAAELPLFPAADIGRMVDMCERIMREHGLIPRHTQRASSKTIQFTLMPDMVFKLSDGEELTLGALEERVKQSGEQHGYATLFDPGTQRADRVKAGMSRYGLYLRDWKTEVSYHWKDKEPLDASAFAEDLKATAQEQGYTVPPKPPQWREKYVETCFPKASFHNAMVAIEAIGLTCFEDVFHNKLWIAKTREDERLDACAGEVTDSLLLHLRKTLSDAFGFDLTAKHVVDAAAALCGCNKFDPVVAMLAVAEADWDGVERLDRMAVDVFNADDTELNRAFVRKFMLGAVARARTPGVKFDTILVLESPQGWEKTQVLEMLAGTDNYTNERILGKEGKEAMETSGGVWIVEIAELAKMKRTDVEDIKSFASRTEDRARMAYGHFVTIRPRRFVMAATTNEQVYLMSQTGNRRFWPIAVRKRIDLEQLRAIRLQLWGEAAHWHSKGESIVLPEHLWEEAGVEQEARRVQHGWEVLLEDLCPAGNIGYGGFNIVQCVHNTWFVSTRDLFKALGIDGVRMKSWDEFTLSTAMRKLGWGRDRVTIGGSKLRGYSKPVPSK